MAKEKTLPQKVKKAFDEMIDSSEIHKSKKKAYDSACKDLRVKRANYERLKKEHINSLPNEI